MAASPVRFFAPLRVHRSKSFLLEKSLLFLLMIVVGGMGYFFGPFIGAGVAVLLPIWIENAQSSLLAACHMWAEHMSYLIVYAALVLVMIIFMPKGNRRRGRHGAHARRRPMLTARTRRWREPGMTPRSLKSATWRSPSAVSMRCAGVSFDVREGESSA